MAGKKKTSAPAPAPPEWLPPATDAFRRAAAGEINPSELARNLRELLAVEPGPQVHPFHPKLREFLDLDLGDFAYSLALHDQPAIAALHQGIKQWAETLTQPAAAPVPRTRDRKKT